MEKPYVLSRREIAMREMLYIPHGDLGEADLTPYMPPFFLAEKHAYAGPSLATLVNHALDTTFPSCIEPEKETTQISFLKDGYGISHVQAHAHRWGSGGAYQHASVFSRYLQHLLVTVDFAAWDTTSDDSMDYASFKAARTYLLADDPVARAVFAAISEAR